MKKLLLLLFALLFLSLGAQAQRNCVATEYMELQQQTYPKFEENRQQIEQHTSRMLAQPGLRSVNGTITIPVVVHVVYNNQSENISMAQIQSQIDVLNEDFRRLNPDASDTPGDFQPVAADSEIEFCLATIDPQGNPTNGVTRTQTSNASFAANNTVKFSSSGGKDAWPADQYMNFWVCDISGGILGYAQFPGGPASTDGIVVDYLYFGTIGTATPPFDLGRTATHEVGHYLNLRHIWGDGNCNIDDQVGDTPRAGGPNYSGGSCTYPGPNSCNEGAGDLPDMFQNYMDYSNDGCMNLFTRGQKVRMRALFEPGGFRESLLNSTACGPVSPPTCDDGIQNGDEEGVDCGGSFCDACPCYTAELTLSITLDNYPEETSWSVTNASNAIVASGGTYGNLPNGTTVTENINLSGGSYTFTINDTYGDGICCQYGSGSYALTDSDGAVIASGGAFSSSESTDFCTDPPAATCDDGIQNGAETGIDCGGPDCPACPTCSDGIQNGAETGVDCGGPGCAPCVQSCDAPLNLQASNLTSSSALLSWNVVPAADTYELQYLEQGAPVSNLLSLNVGSSSSIVDGLEAGTAYLWRVRALCSGENAPWSSVETFTTLSDSCPDDDNDGICNADDQCPGFDDNLIGTACDDGDDCTENDTYGNDCNCAGTLIDNNNNNICDLEEGCNDPVNLNAIAFSNTSAQFSWDAVPAASTYRLQYRPIGGNPVSLDIPDNMYVANGLPPASTVQWRVRALCANENSGFVVGPAVTLSDPTRTRTVATGFELFPNPTSGSFTLLLKEWEDRNGRVLIRSAVGQVLYQTTTADSQLKIDLRALNIPAGVLFITVQKEGLAPVTKRLMYNRK